MMSANSLDTLTCIPLGPFSPACANGPRLYPPSFRESCNVISGVIGLAFVLKTMTSASLRMTSLTWFTICSTCQISVTERGHRREAQKLLIFPSLSVLVNTKNLLQWKCVKGGVCQHFPPPFQIQNAAVSTNIYDKHLKLADNCLNRDINLRWITSTERDRSE